MSVPTTFYVPGGPKQSGADESQLVLNLKTRVNAIDDAIQVDPLPNTISKRDGAGVLRATAVTANTLTSSGATLDIGTTSTTINIKNTSGGPSVVNIGGVGDTVYVPGTLTTVNTANLAVTDKFITLNVGGAAASAGLSAIKFEEGGSSTGAFIRLSSGRDKIELKAPTGSTIGLNQSLLTTDPATFTAVTATSATVSGTVSANALIATTAKLSTGAAAGKLLMCSDGLGNANWTVPIIPSNVATYSSVATYALNDQVYYSGAMYKSLMAGNLNNQPDTYSGIASPEAFYDTSLAPSSSGSDASMQGCHFTVSKNCLLTKIRTYRFANNTATGAYVWQVAPNKLSATLLGTYVDTQAGTLGWHEIAISPPLQLTAGTFYTVGRQSNNSYSYQRPPTHQATSVLSQILIDNTSGSYGSNTAGVWPNGGFGGGENTSYYITPIIQSAWEAVAVNMGGDITGTSKAAVVSKASSGFTVTGALIATSIKSDSSIEALTAKFTTGAGANRALMSDASGNGVWSPNITVANVTATNTSTAATFTTPDDRDATYNCYWEGGLYGATSTIRFVRKDNIVHVNFRQTTQTTTDGFTLMNPICTIASMDSKFKPTGEVHIPLMASIEGGKKWAVFLKIDSAGILQVYGHDYLIWTRPCYMHAAAGSYIIE